MTQQNAELDAMVAKIDPAFIAKVSREVEGMVAARLDEIRREDLRARQMTGWFLLAFVAVSWGFFLWMFFK